MFQVIILREGGRTAVLNFHIRLFVRVKVYVRVCGDVSAWSSITPWSEQVQ